MTENQWREAAATAVRLFDAGMRKEAVAEIAQVLEDYATTDQLRILRKQVQNFRHAGIRKVVQMVCRRAGV